MSKSKTKWLAVTMGDPCGIGPEVIAKALRSRKCPADVNYVVIGHETTFDRYKPPLHPSAFIHIESTGGEEFEPGHPDEYSGEASLLYLRAAIELLKKKKVDGLVTAPLSKEWVERSCKGFQGHTEFLAEHSGTKRYGMLFVAGGMKSLILTRHIPLSAVPGALSRKLIVDNLVLLNQQLKQLFKIKQPRIAVCGLNPHAGENGLIGREDITIIVPALAEARKKGIVAEGPFAADTLFTALNRKRYDAFVAMYHDQGLIPVKTLYFHEVVNLTIGLPYVRTSPAHGTGFDIAGKKQADPSSMIEAMRLAAKLVS